MTADKSLTLDQVSAEMSRVVRLIGARDGKLGCKQNVIVLKARLSELTTLQETLQMPPNPAP